jgi:plastocyanin
VGVVATDGFRFVPDSISARAGAIRIQLSNEGSYPHNLSLPDLHVTSKTVTGSPGGSTTVLAFTVDKPGQYRFVCTFHDQAGMTGTLTVTP